MIIPPYVPKMLVHYISLLKEGRLKNRAQVRDCLFLDLLELELPVLFSHSDWRNLWFTEHKFPANLPEGWELSVSNAWKIANEATALDQEEPTLDQEEPSEDSSESE